MGAIQDVMLVKSLKVPAWLTHALRPVPFIYLGLAVFLAATDRYSVFIICRFDPFVDFFRMSGPMHMLVIGAGVLVLAMFVARPYCRFLCPYGALLGLVSRVSWRGVRITPDKCVSCRLCENACPVGAIAAPTGKEETQ